MKLYCYRVASAVGLACIHIWGFSRAQAKVHAEQAGLAFQLTNILRDLGEDAARGGYFLSGVSCPARAATTGDVRLVHFPAHRG